MRPRIVPEAGVRTLLMFVGALAVTLALASSAEAAVLKWSAVLGGGNEIPPNATTGDGSGTVIYDDVLNMLALDLEWQGLTGDGVQAHIHCCVPTPPGNVGIALDLWLVGNPRPASGTYSAVYDLDTVNPFRAAFVAANGGTTLLAMQALIAAMNAGDRAYFNIHTVAFPGGEIRGNLVPVPEPAGVLLLAGGLLAVLRRRTRRP